MLWPASVYYLICNAHSGWTTSSWDDVSIPTVISSAQGASILLAGNWHLYMIWNASNDHAAVLDERCRVKPCGGGIGKGRGIIGS